MIVITGVESLVILPPAAPLSALIVYTVASAGATLSMTTEIVLLVAVLPALSETTAR